MKLHFRYFVSFFVAVLLLSCENHEMQRLIPYHQIGKIMPKNSSEISSSPFGIQAGTLEDSLVARAAEIGVKWTRLGASWPSIEKEKGVYSWEECDKAFQVAIKNGITPFITIGGGNKLYSKLSTYDDPALAEIYGSSPEPPIKDPIAMVAFLKFVKATVERYKDEIDYWEVWNEPNHRNYWGSEPDGKEYGRLLVETAKLIKKIDPGSKVIGGSMAGIIPQFADDFLSVGSDKIIDIISYHNYGAVPEERVYPAIELWLGEAASAAKELIENGPYFLYSTGDIYHDYNAFHRMIDLTGNPEVIYWRKYDPEIKTNNISRQHHKFCGGVSRNMVEDYLCTDGLPITLSSLYMGDANIENVFKNRDPRLRQTVLHPDDGYYYKVQTNELYPFPRIEGMSNLDNMGSTSGYQEIKHFLREDFDRGSEGYMPAITLRFGEALLNYAEAKAELGNMTQADLDISINKLRDRVGMPHMSISNIPVDPRYVNDGISPLIAEIRRERRVELYGEGFRYDDLRRWKQGKKLEKPTMGILWDDVAKKRYQKAKVLSSIDPENGKPYIHVYKNTIYENVSFDENKYYLWPLPLSILAENTSIEQNPGW